MRNKILLAIVLALFTQLTIAQNFNKSKLDAYFNVLEASNRFMGSVAVSKNNEIIYTRAIGYSDIEDGIKANKNSKYRIGSISKTFTAVLILKAVESGNIDLNQTIDQYFPKIHNAEKITIEHLLYHRSGIHDFTNDPDYLTWNTESKSEYEMVDIITKGGSDFEPGSKSEYSNSNYVLLSYILQWTFKMPYSVILDTYIAQPLELKNTYLGSKINVNDNECESYIWKGHWEKETETNMIIPLGAGGIVSTPSDLVIFSNALFGGRLILKESLRQMEMVKDDFGMGLFQVPFGNKKGFGHTGRIDGFSSVFIHFGAGNISYALLSNGTNFNNNDISIAVLSAAYNRPFKNPDFKVITLSSEDLDKYLGVYSSPEIPLEITVTKNNFTLIAQATGQSSFALEPTEKDKFKFEGAGVVMEFDPSNETLILKQAGGTIMFKKK